MTSRKNEAGGSGDFDVGKAEQNRDPEATPAALSSQGERLQDSMGNIIRARCLATMNFLLSKGIARTGSG